MTTIDTGDITATCTPCGVDAWQIDFTSPHQGRCHQLYANGILADWTDTPDARRFIFSGQAQPTELLLAAVAVADRTRDLHALLPAAEQPSWVFHATVCVPPAAPSDATICLTTDAGGAETVLAQRPAYPPNAPRIGMGLDGFGQSANGYGAGMGVGLGNGVFGQGPLGLDRQPIQITAPLLTEGRQHVHVSIRWPGGEIDFPPQTVLAMPPPAPPHALTIIDSDTQTHTLTLQITR